MYSYLAFISGAAPLPPPPRALWTCRRRSSLSSSSSSEASGGRGRGSKRAALHLARESYRAHFEPLLAVESAAEQAAWAAAARAPPPLRGVSVLRKKGRVMSGCVYALGGAGKGRKRISVECGLKKGDVVNVRGGAEGEVEVEGSVMERGAWEVFVVVKIGGDGCGVMDGWVEDGEDVVVFGGANGIAGERASFALEVVTGKEGMAELDIAGMIVRSLEEGVGGMLKGGPSKQVAAGGVSGGKWEEVARASPSRADKAASASAVREVCASLSVPLNTSQRAAVKHSLERSVSIIQGPPGTGKTVTAACIIAAAVRAGCGPVLATAASNVAVDNLLEKLLDVGRGAPRDRVNIVRVGRVAAVAESLWDFTLEGILEKDPAVRRAREEAERNPSVSSKSYEVERLAAVRILRRADVVLTTCVGAGRDIFEELCFSFLLCDEATQSTEPDLLVPLMAGNAPTLRQLVLVGDHHQLPPTVLCQGEEGEKLGHSLFSRFWSAGVASMMLNTQYRMHPQIASFPSKHFYFSKLVSAVKKEDRPLPLSLPTASANEALPSMPRVVSGETRREGRVTGGVSGDDLANLSGIDTERLLGLLQKNRVIFIDSESGVEERDSLLRELDAAFSYVNRVEARLVCNIVHQLRYPPGDVGVISPYSAQVRLISRALASERDSQVHVSTVDGFQGREKEVIIFSAVRSNKQGRVGFLADWRRLNVALTRARKVLIVIGTASTLKNDPHWQTWLRSAPCYALSSLGKASSAYK